MQSKDTSSYNIYSDQAVKCHSMLKSLQNKKENMFCSNYATNHMGSTQVALLPLIKRSKSCVCVCVCLCVCVCVCVCSWETTISSLLLLQIQEIVHSFSLGKILCSEGTHPMPIAKALKDIYSHVVLGLRRKWAERKQN